MTFRLHMIKKKSRIWETKNLSTDADSSTAAKKLLSIFFTPPHRRRCRPRQGAFEKNPFEVQFSASLLSMFVAGKELHDLESNNYTFSEVTCEPLPRFFAQRRNSDRSTKLSVSTLQDQAGSVGWGCCAL